MNERLKKIRETLKYNQDEFSKIMEVNQSTLSSYEKSSENTMKITIKSLKQLKEKLNVNLEYLLTGQGEMFIDENKYLESKSNSDNESYIFSKKVIEDFKSLNENSQKAIYLEILKKLKEDGKI